MKYKYVYILDEFPKISETFILNEILQIREKSNTEVKVFVFSNPHEDKVHTRAKEIKEIVYLPQVGRLKKVYAHLFFLILKPRRYISTFRLAKKPENHLWGVFKNYLYFVLLIFRSKPTHIHAHFGLRTADLALLTALLTGTEYTFTTHRFDLFEHPASNYKIKSKLAKKHITISKFNKNYIVREFGVDEKNIDVIYCGVDFDQIHLQPKDTEESVIFSAARLIEQKGLDTLIQACAELKKEHIPFQCLVAGEGPERENLEKLISRLGLKEVVRLLGNKDQKEIFELLSKSTIFVLPSRSEGLPVALMEAMAMKIPVVSTSVCGIPELVEKEKCGLLIKPDNVDELAQALKKLLMDRKLRTVFAGAGYEKVFRNFNIRDQIEKLLRVYQHNG